MSRCDIIGLNPTNQIIIICMNMYRTETDYYRYQKILQNVYNRISIRYSNVFCDIYINRFCTNNQLQSRMKIKSVKVLM